MVGFFLCPKNIPRERLTDSVCMYIYIYIYMYFLNIYLYKYVHTPSYTEIFVDVYYSTR